MIYLIFIVVCILLSTSSTDNTLDIAVEGEKYGDSVYTRFQDDVYALIPDDGYYKIDSADIHSFNPLRKDLYESQIAKDKNNVYCGNRILPNLDPKSLTVLNYEYFSDGVHTYYCSRNTSSNNDLSVFGELSQTIVYNFKLGAKPQRLIYPFVELPKNSIYRSLPEHGFATDGKQAYYRGLPLARSNPESLRRINTITGERNGKLSDDFFADGQHVYFHDQLLPLTDDPSLYGFYFGAWNLPLLYDPRIGMVYLRTLAFDKNNAPYEVVNTDDGHGHHLLFSSKEGLFYFDTETNLLKRERRNPFLPGDFSPLSNYVFHWGQKVLYLETSEVWGRNKSPGLKSRSTHIYQLANVTDEQWQQMGDVSYDSGAVWKNGDSYYYLDELGDSQGIHGAIYRIADNQTVQLLLTDNLTKTLNSADILQLIEEKKLTVPAHTELLEIKTKYDF
ncbi:hypothetical protein J2X66_005967 [Pseudomonas sp. 3296]|uniref:DKNYY domain-containing protein n=1 Tax=Pseudomonas sp. 3296 TaxID=2817753 RepID=UPI00285A61AC|nr:DKNYY domain-containing protein [Pseudomonas sp. 3296]MDR6919062.1 hypothetical protein [Pseudomonas sp. 3296]